MRPDVGLPSATGSGAESVLRWAGSKRQLLPQIVKVLPTGFGTYYEPFAGSACLFFAIAPRKAVLSDYNQALMTAWKQISDNPTQIAKAVTDIPTDSDSYYAMRARQPTNEFDAAVRFIYLNRLCFNGVYRTNRKGQFNVPIGRRTGAVPPPEAFEACSTALQRATLLCADYRTAVQTAESNDLVYLDPPYASTHRHTYGEYGYGSFNEAQELDIFVDLLQDLDRRGVKVLVSYGSSDILGSLREKWTVVQVQSLRRLAADPAKRRVTPGEILAWNY